MRVSECVGKECIARLHLLTGTCVHLYTCVYVCVLAARLGVRGLVFLHLRRAELLICTSLSADARKSDQAIRSTLCWKEEGSPLLSRRVL